MNSHRLNDPTAFDFPTDKGRIAGCRIGENHQEGGSHFSTILATGQEPAAMRHFGPATFLRPLKDRLMLDKVRPSPVLSC